MGFLQFFIFFEIKASVDAGRKAFWERRSFIPKKRLDKKAFSLYNSKALRADAQQNMRVWRNWQTRKI